LLLVAEQAPKGWRLADNGLMARLFHALRPVAFPTVALASRGGQGTIQKVRMISDRDACQQLNDTLPVRTR
jgi:hypothetical protein